MPAPGYDRFLAELSGSTAELDDTRSALRSARPSSETRSLGCSELGQAPAGKPAACRGHGKSDGYTWQWLCFSE
jgi:hypothetical protein